VESRCIDDEFPCVLSCLNFVGVWEVLDLILGYISFGSALFYIKSRSHSELQRRLELVTTRVYLLSKAVYAALRTRGIISMLPSQAGLPIRLEEK
jgi:hypothetical protein